ncbi:MAG: hypothetical protein EA368_12380 [Leptolyngbya sp. DLM2.Bin27]|nr:MAG: hypothetical protein EA368_12380 [Leptolyngbya sp. DLM2.Bin27]
MTEPTSLHSFCKDRNLAKTTVRRWLNEQGYSTSEGLSPAAVEAALTQFCPAALPSAAAAAPLAKVEILTGNHRATLEAPAMPGQIDLARFRGDIEVRSYEDPVNEAAAAMALFDALSSAMDKDLDQSFTQLETTTVTVQQLEQRAEALKEKQLEYQITQKILARLQNQKTSELSELLGKAQALGGGGGQ